MTSRPNRFRPMEPAAFRRALNQLGLNMSEFARLTGAQSRRVERWTKGEEDIPHATHALVTLMLADPANVYCLAGLTADSLLPEEEHHEKVPVFAR